MVTPIVTLLLCMMTVKMVPIKTPKRGLPSNLRKSSLTMGESFRGPMASFIRASP